MYEFDSRVRYSEVDHHGTMTVPALINYFQDCSTFQSEDLGIGTTVLKEEKRAWLLSYWQVILNRKPELGEKITIGTFATEFKGLFGNRNFYIKVTILKSVSILFSRRIITMRTSLPGMKRCTCCVTAGIDLCCRNDPADISDVRGAATAVSTVFIDNKIPHRLL